MIEKLLRFLPVKLRRNLEQRHGLTNILNNIIWLFFDKLIRLGVGLLVGVWIARYLGPEQFGLLNYAIAFVALFTAVSNLGLYGIVVRDLVQNPTLADTTMGTSFALQALGGLCAFGLALLSIIYVRSNDSLAILIVALLALLMAVKATDVVRYWFESKVHAKYVVWTENAVFLIFAIVKIVLVVAEATLMAFVWALFAESLFVAVGLLGVYAWQGGNISAWRCRFDRAKTLLSDSWPLLLSGLAIMVYMRIDQIMLGQMLGDEYVGIYSAAVRISEVWYFIPMAITVSVFPSIIKAKKTNEVKYKQRLQKLYDIMVLLALVVAIPMTFLSDLVVTLLFGNAYVQAGSVLSIHIWAGIFAFLWVASGRWFIIEGLQKYAFYRNLLGAAVNIGLNLILIPNFGVIGAAWATVVSLACVSVLFNVFNSKTRPVFFMLCKSFLIIGIFRKGHNDYQ